MPNPLSNLQIQTLKSATQTYIELSQQKFPHHTIRPVIIRFDLKGSIAGQYRSGESLIRYNPHIAVRHFDDFKIRTVAHEVAHHIVQEIWGNKRLYVRPHGREWQSVMHLLGITDISRCHDYPLDGIKIKRQRRFRYACRCREHELPTTRHNRVLKGLKYKCAKCHNQLHNVDINSI